MNHSSLLLRLAALAACLPLLATAAPTASTAGHGGTAGGNFQWLNDYCSKCHNAEDWAGGVAFDTIAPEAIGSDAKVWEEAVTKLRGRLMPPAGEKQPPQQQVDQFVRWMEGELDANAARAPDPGRVGLHRLNRNEYARVIEELLGLRVNPELLLPKDTRSEGFDNVAAVLKVSPTFLDQYVQAARTVSSMAIGEARPRSASQTYRAPASRQAFYQEGMPLGTRGGMAVEHWFPADGDYEFNLRVPVGGGYGLGMAEQTVVLLIDGKRVFEQKVGGETDSRAVDQQQAPAQGKINARFQKIRVPVKAGPRRIVATFVATSFAESEALFAPFVPGGGSDSYARVAGMDIVGPFNPTGVGATPSRHKVFSCYPTSADQERPCAQQIIARLAREAFRRPVTETDLAAPLRFYDEGQRAGGFEAGVQTALMAILSSPKFLYRVELPPAGVVAGQPYALDDLALASRLSFFLWSRGPDEQLLQLAADGKLKDPAVLQAQVRRMLADERSRSLISNFATQWLNVENLDNVDPDGVLFPSFDEELRRGFRREMELFADSVLRSDGRITDLLTADYSFLNERLALHYGVPNIRGDQFRRVQLADSARWGLLGKGAMLMSTSYGNRTAPVLRGNWILERVLGTPPSAPPPGVEALKENAPGAPPTTVRQRLEQHRAQPSCNGCHAVMDPLGFALENFDAVGAWRDRDREVLTPVDASARFVDGTRFADVNDLRSYLAGKPDQFAQTLTEKLMVFALGRAVEYTDRPRIRAIVREAATQDYRFSALLTGVVLSDQFRYSRSPELARSTP